MRELLAHLKEAILRLVTTLANAGHVVKMPGFDPDMESYANGVFKLEVLREVPEQKHSREWLSETARLELEDWEREQGAMFDGE